MNNRDVISNFLRAYGASSVGDTPVQPYLPLVTDDEGLESADTIDLSVEVEAAQWSARIVGEAPAKPGEYPTRFIDGSLAAVPVLYLRPPQGWPIPVLLGQIGAVAMRLQGRSLLRDLAIVERDFPHPLFPCQREASRDPVTINRRQDLRERRRRQIAAVLETLFHCGVE